MDFQNYFSSTIMLVIMTIAFSAFLLPTPYNLIMFLTILYTGEIGFMIFYPRLTRLIANWRGNVLWARIDVAKKALWYASAPKANIQFWFEGTPGSIEIKDAWGHFVEWLTILPLKDHWGHSYYNGGRKVGAIALKHSDYSFMPDRGIHLSEDERQSLSTWTRLFPKNGGVAYFDGMLGYHKTADWFAGVELIPTAEELEYGEEALRKNQEVLNNVPIIKNGIAIMVVKVMRAAGSSQIEEDLRNTHPILEMPILEPRETEVNVPYITVRASRGKGP